MPNIDLAGNTLIVQDIQVGATTPGSSGTSLSSTELSFVDGITAGTATASKALVLDSSKGIATITSATITTANVTTLALAAGGTVDLDSTTATLSSNAATITKWACKVTTEALTTAAGASQAFTITLSGVAAGDFAFVQGTGAGTNTRNNHNYTAACTSNTVTVTVRNTEPTNALNGTLVFNLIVFKQ